MNLRTPTHIRKLAVLVCSFMLVLAGCGNGAQQGIVEGKVNVVTSFYPIYYMVNEIGGEHVNAINLIPAGVEPHDWTPKSRDLQNASKSQLLMVNGAGFEGWLDDFVKGLDSTSTIKTIEVSKGVALIEADGAHEESADHAHEEGHEDGDAEGHEHDHDHGSTDPHTWVSPKSALVMAKNVKDALVQEDAAHQAEYESNYEKLKSKLEAIDAKYEESLKNVKHRDIVVSHHAFGYLSRDYGLTQHAIMGITPDAEPRAQDLLRLSKLVQEKGLKYVFFEELVSDQLAKTLASEAKADILVLSPLEGLTKEQADAGDNYLTLMERNLQNLLLALQ
ncbi:zinc ABC transporter substrate-binding protein [Paenibacillus profundus]|uniref:Zinc ABC transporter substrate-binding protein n=1 Tax=Paenibacillus profundus TaxID=1173085 RepID=A0ABS8YPL8_9BACL|nr:zinc ABC transporter substrate-binding protein [Paenibacillus profundus]MCE5173217.1 zinc ABC transporter substrate-binding protein [Paenibacillus profundus]